MTMVLKDKSSEQLRTTTLSGNGHAQQDLGTITGLVLRPEMSYCDAGRAVLGYHLNRLLANEAGTIEGDDPEPLHQMRVATRRLRAALRDFATAFGDELDPFVREVRWLSRLLGRIRDLDVFIAWLREYEQNAPAEQRPLVHIIVQDRETARVRERAALLTGLRSGRYNDFTRTFSQFVHAEATPTQCNHQPLIDMAASKVERQLARVRRALADDLLEWKYVDPQAPAWMLRHVPDANERRLVSGLTWTWNKDRLEVIYLPTTRTTGKRLDEAVTARWTPPKLPRDMPDRKAGSPLLDAKPDSIVQRPDGTAAVSVHTGNR